MTHPVWLSLSESCPVAIVCDVIAVAMVVVFVLVAMVTVFVAAIVGVTVPMIDVFTRMRDTL